MCRGRLSQEVTNQLSNWLKVRAVEAMRFCIRSRRKRREWLGPCSGETSAIPAILDGLRQFESLPGLHTMGPWRFMTATTPPKITLPCADRLRPAGSTGPSGAGASRLARRIKGEAIYFLFRSRPWLATGSPVSAARPGDRGQGECVFIPADR
jgi:hypothetical protein